MKDRCFDFKTELLCQGTIAERKVKADNMSDLIINIGWMDRSV